MELESHKDNKWTLLVFMVGKAFSAVIKLDYVFDSPKTRLFIHGKDKLAKYMVYVTTFFKVRDHYIFKN